MDEVAVNALDNPVWSSISGAHGELADVASAGAGAAGCYRHDVAPFAGLEDATNPACWTALASILGSHATCVLVDPAEVPDGWEIIRAIPGVQMDGTALATAEDTAAVPLTTADVPEMLALVERTRPGPYLQRTIEMGRYLGLRTADGELIAMAGERLHPVGWTEISAVCTDDRHRGQGLGTRLVRAIAAGVRERGEVPFLHAAADNVNAIRLYEALGFTVRRTCSFTIVKPGAASE